MGRRGDRSAGGQPGRVTRVSQFLLIMLRLRPRVADQGSTERPAPPYLLLRDGTTDVQEDGVICLDVDPHGSRWLRIIRPGDRYIL